MSGGCQKQEPEKPQEVHNTFTNYVDNGITAMNKAQSVADQTNQAVAQTNAQTQKLADQ